MADKAASDLIEQDCEDFGTTKIEEYEFKNRGFNRANMSKFWSFMKSGSDQNTNIVAQMSSVSVFAFIDKQGICTEN